MPRKRHARLVWREQASVNPGKRRQKLIILYVMLHIWKHFTIPSFAYSKEVAFAQLRIYGPFTVDWIQRAIPDLRPTQMVLAQWIVEHNRLMMECPKPVVSGSHRMLQRLL